MLTADLLLTGYQIGIFPMADLDGSIGWYAPDPRAVLPLDQFHVPKTLAKTVRRGVFEVEVNRDFEGTVRACAAPAPGREVTWISEDVVHAYSELHRMGLAHSVECWRDGDFAGGLYGVALGGAFFGESMVSRQRDASKVALVALVERLRAGGFAMLDTQMTTPHLERFGVTEIPRAVFERDLEAALRVRGDWWALDR
ncbi:leucyl/phenylalanyl-tRNA--protein transferase [Rubrivirga sp.]|uniref:leucyl/phenylalanyl-tRNA--protein transferase n=1 Tax=Rubrivirga sp. TaxID=1885344 RepID=UPI003C78ECCB